MRAKEINFERGLDPKATMDLGGVNFQETFDAAYEKWMSTIQALGGKTITGEIEKQYKKFISIFKFKPSHIDLHKSIYVQEASPFIQKFCKKNNLPSRNHNIPPLFAKMTSNPVINGTKLAIEEIKNKIEQFSEGESYEILLHPGEYDPKCESSLNEKRKEDYEKAIKISNIIKGQKNIKLISYKEL